MAPEEKLQSNWRRWDSSSGDRESFLNEVNISDWIVVDSGFVKLSSARFEFITSSTLPERIVKI